jgi:hypothetical protein
MSDPPSPLDTDCSAFKRTAAEEEAAAIDEDDTDMADMMAEILADEKREKEEAEAKDAADKAAAEAKKVAEAKAKADAEAAAAKKKRKKKKKKVGSSSFLFAFYLLLAHLMLPFLCVLHPAPTEEEEGKKVRALAAPWHQDRCAARHRRGAAG